jgi:hypothetical protein
MAIILASNDALKAVRALPASERRQVRARRHPDGGTWITWHTEAGARIVQALADKYGTREWTPDGWVIHRPQMRLPGVDPADQ